MTQKQALDILMMGENVFLTGQAGSGKTYVLNKYINSLRKNKIGVAVTASTGIAATHLNGITIHSWSGIGIQDEFSGGALSKIAANDRIRNNVQSAAVLIIDEISMFHSYRLDMVSDICKLIRQNESPFGGLQVILCGDFFQLPPINDPGKDPSAFAFNSKSWVEANFEICYLEEQHRQMDNGFTSLLNGIRTSEVDEYSFEKLTNRMNSKLPSHVRPTRLYTHNIDVDTINNHELEKINAEPHVFHMTANGDYDLVRSLKKGCLAPEELALKVGAAVMFVKNNPAKGYVNGTLGTVTAFDEDRNPVVQTFDGNEIVAAASSWTLQDNEDILAEISQVPLRLAWAITVHKSQGMTLDFAEIDLSKSFAFGMGYVALSRVKSLEGIKLLGINQNALLVDLQISEIDRGFKKTSRENSSWVKAMDKSELRQKQKKHFARLLSQSKNPSDAVTKLEELFAGFLKN